MRKKILKEVVTSKLNFIAALLMVVALVSCGSSNDDIDDFTPTNGNGSSTGNTGNNNGGSTDNLENAADFSLTSLAGSTVKLSDYSNKVVVLFFFGSGCPSCKAVGPSVQSQLVTPFSSKTDYQVLGLDQWNGNSNAVQAFKTSTNVTFPLLLNASSVAATYKTTYDRFVVINKAGKIVFSGKQIAASDLAAVKSIVTELLGN